MMKQPAGILHQSSSQVATTSGWLQSGQRSSAGIQPGAGSGQGTGWGWVLSFPPVAPPLLVDAVPLTPAPLALAAAPTPALDADVDLDREDAEFFPQPVTTASTLISSRRLQVMG
jgi:hypothetical protein